MPSLTNSSDSSNRVVCRRRQRIINEQIRQQRMLARRIRRQRRLIMNRLYGRGAPTNLNAGILLNRLIARLPHNEQITFRFLFPQR